MFFLIYKIIYWYQPHFFAFYLVFTSNLITIACSTGIFWSMQKQFIYVFATLATMSINEKIEESRNIVPKGMLGLK